MDRPTRNETLKALDAVGVPEDVWTESQGIIREAARLYAVLAPDTCPECGGYGTTMIRVQEPSVYGTTIHEGPKTVDCPSCGGRGYVWPDTTVKRAMDFLDDLLLASGNVDDFTRRAGIMRAVPDLLDVLWEVDNG